MLMFSYGNIGIVAFLEINPYVNFVLSMQPSLNIILKLNLVKKEVSRSSQPGPADLQVSFSVSSEKFPL